MSGYITKLNYSILAGVHSTHAWDVYGRHRRGIPILWDTAITSEFWSNGVVGIERG
jgi:hypothetical protein